MVIVGSFYRLTPINNSSPRYDLELLCDIKGKNPRKEWKVEAYGISLEYAIIKCINYATRQKFQEDQTITLKDYLNEFRKQKDAIKYEILKGYEEACSPSE